MHGNMLTGISAPTKTQHIEYDYLAPDTINEIFSALAVLQTLKPDEEGTAETNRMGKLYHAKQPL